MKKIIILIFSILIAHYVSNAQTVIKMKKENGVYTIPCKVNELKLKFIFDTGASDVSISLTEAIFMLKNDYLSKNDIIGTEKYSIANGEIAEGTTIILKVIEIEGLKLYNVRASIVHNLEAPLLLGQSAIEKLGPIQLNGDELIILNKGNTHYDYANDIADNNTNSTINHQKKEYKIPEVYKKNFSGVMKVYTYSPIFDKPDMVNGKQIGKVLNNKVLILERINGKYYKVKSGDTIGYFWSGYFIY